MKFLADGEVQIKELEVPMTNDEIIESRIKAIRLLIAKWEATQEEKEELALLIW